MRGESSDRCQISQSSYIAGVYRWEGICSNMGDIYIGSTINSVKRVNFPET